MSERTQSQQQLKDVNAKYLLEYADRIGLGGIIKPSGIHEIFNNLEPGEQRRALLISQLGEFIDTIAKTHLSKNKQLERIERDSNRKGGDNSKFGEYARKFADIFENLKDYGEIDSWWYISQANKTELERDLDTSKVDWIVKTKEGNYVLIQTGTTPRNTREKKEGIIEYFKTENERFDPNLFLGVMPILDDNKAMLSDEKLGEGIHEIIKHAESHRKNLNRLWYAFRGSNT